MANLTKIPPRYTTNIFKGGKKKYLKLAAEWMADNGGKIGGFTKEHGYLKGKNASDKMTVFGISSKGTLLDKIQSLGLKQEAEVRRKERIADQTGNVETFDWKNKPKGFDGHHRRMIALYAPFYEGLNNKDKLELTQWFIDEGFPLGDAKENLALLSEEDHTGAEDSIHKWMRENNIQVRPGKPGESNFVFSKDGKIDFVRGGSDLGSSKAKEGTALMPNLSHLSLNERLYPAAAYLENVQQPVEEQLAKYTANTNPANQTNSLDPNATYERSVKPPTLDEVKRMRRLGQVWDRKLQTFVPKTKAIPGTHFNRNMNLASKGAETVLRELPGSREVIIGAETGMALSKGDVTGAGIAALKGNTDPTGSISTIEPLNQRHPYKAIGRDIKIDNITDTLAQMNSDGFGAI